MDIRTLQSDPEFMALPFEEKKKAIAVLDPTFKSLQPSEQDRGLQMIFPRDVRESIAERKRNPPANAMGDPNGGDMTAGDVGGALVRGAAHGVGLPTSLADAKAMVLDSMIHGGPGGAMAYGALKDVTEGHVPIVGRALEALAKPVSRVIHGEAPTNQERLTGIESGTTLGTIAALQHPAVGGVIGKVGDLGAEGGALDLSAQRGMADVVDPSGANPLRAPMADMLRNEGVTLKNPPRDLARMANERGAPTDTTSPILDSSGNAIQKQLTPEQQIWNEVSKAAANSQEPASITAGTMKRVIPEVVLGTAAKVLGVPHSVIAAVLGGSELIGIGRKIMSNPLWKSTSAVVKTDMAKALRSGDVGTALTIGARVAGGVNLDDNFGHDQAIHSAVTDAMAQANGDPSVARQILAGQEAVYENPDGSTVPVPFHITRAFVNGLGNVPNGNQRVVAGNAQGRQDQVGRSTGVPPEGIAHDFAGNAIGPAPDELQNYRAYWGPIR